MPAVYTPIYAGVVRRVADAYIYVGKVNSGDGDPARVSVYSDTDSVLRVELYLLYLHVPVCAVKNRSMVECGADGRSTNKQNVSTFQHVKTSQKSTGTGHSS